MLIAIGKNSKASGASVALGEGAVVEASGGFSVAVGYHSKVNSKNSLAIGADSSAIGFGSISLGLSLTNGIGAIYW